MSYRRPGSLNYELVDAATYCAWKIDYIKIDACRGAQSTQKSWARKRAVLFSGWVFFLIPSGSPHVRCTPMERTRGEPDDIGLTPMGVKLNGWGRAGTLPRGAGEVL